MFDLETWELWSYIVTVVGLPYAIVLFYFDQKKERNNEEEEVFQRLSESYADFLKPLLENADLGLLSKAKKDDLTEEQVERRKILFTLLISLFEQAYLLAYEEKMDKDQQRRWASWEDYMKEWCRNKDFNMMLLELLDGEDPDFSNYILTLSKKCN